MGGLAHLCRSATCRQWTFDGERGIIAVLTVIQGDAVRRIPPVFIVMIAASLAWGAAPAKNEHVQATLLTDVSAIQAGEPFTVGVMLKIDPHWHVYWLNPGDSGEATKVSIEAPEGLKVGPVQLPVPVKFMQPGDMIGYGYMDEVMITAKVTPPADLPPGSPVD